MTDAAKTSGGLRLVVDGMRGSPGRAQSVVDTLRGIPGVREVTADAQTGSVVIRYEPQPRVALLPPRDVPVPRGEDAPSPRGAPSPTLTRIVETVVVVALEVALRRALGPFWPKRC